MQGIQGIKGDTGFSPIASVTKTDGIATISITDINGTTTATVLDGVTPTVETSFCGSSLNAQSGKAVSEAISSKASPIILSTDIGENLAVTDSSDNKANSISIYGKSIQNETPSPQNPIEIISIENPTISIKKDDSDINPQILTIPYTLRGLKNGNTWIARDQILVNNSEKTVTFIKRCREVTYNGSIPYMVQDMKSTSYGARFNCWLDTVKITHMGAISNKFTASEWNYDGNSSKPTSIVSEYTIMSNPTAHLISFATSDSTLANKTYQEFNTWLSQNPATVVYALTNAEELDITNTEIGKSLLALHTNYPNTNIICYTECQIDYIVDTTIAYKKIMNSIAALGGAI